MGIFGWSNLDLLMDRHRMRLNIIKIATELFKPEVNIDIKLHVKHAQCGVIVRILLSVFCHTLAYITGLWSGWRLLRFEYVEIMLILGILLHLGRLSYSIVSHDSFTTQIGYSDLV